MTFLKEYMTKHGVSSKSLALTLAASGVPNISAVAIRQWMCGNHKPYRTAIANLRAAGGQWDELAAVLETDLEMAHIDAVDTWEGVKKLHKVQI